MIRGMKRKCWTTATVALATGLLMYGNASTVSAAGTGPGFEDPNNWPQYGRTFNNWRFSPLDQIDKSNVKKLKVAWVHQPGDIEMGLQVTPIVIDGVMYYVSANNNVWAVDAATGKTIWHYKAKLDKVAKQVFFKAANKNVTVGRGKVFLGTLDGRFVALDQKTGTEVWSTQIIHTKAKDDFGKTFNASPMLAGDILFGSSTGGDTQVIGKIWGVNADTGKLAWTFEVPKDDPKSWPGESRSKAGGGSWLPGTYDPRTDTIYIGTSNPGPDYYGETRRGNNEYNDSVLALDPKSGKLKWARQEIANDVWDWDSVYEIMLIPNKGKDVIVHPNKGGYTYVMDKDTGKLENVWKQGEYLNWVKSINPKTGELIGRNEPEVGKSKVLCPSTLGARQWNHASYDPNTNLLYTHGFGSCHKITSAAPSKDEPLMDQLTMGVSEMEMVNSEGVKADGWIGALDPITGAVKWKVRWDLPPLGSMLTTQGGLLFTGDSEGMLFAYDVDDGKELWRFNAGSGLRSGPVTYSVNGKQYVVFPTGLGSWSPIFLSQMYPKYKDLPGGAAVIAFTLE